MYKWKDANLTNFIVLINKLLDHFQSLFFKENYLITSVNRDYFSNYAYVSFDEMYIDTVNKIEQILNTFQ
jgi:hypothetical protein